MTSRPEDPEILEFIMRHGARMTELTQQGKLFELERMVERLANKLHQTPRNLMLRMLELSGNAAAVNSAEQINTLIIIAPNKDHRSY